MVEFKIKPWTLKSAVKFARKSGVFDTLSDASEWRRLHRVKSKDLDWEGRVQYSLRFGFQHYRFKLRKNYLIILQVYIYDTGGDWKLLAKVNLNKLTINESI